MSTEISARINLRKDVLVNWQEKNPVLGSGEIAIVEGENGLLTLKIGNGLSSFNQLPFLYQQNFETDKITSKEAVFKSISQGYNVSSTPTSLATGVYSEANGSFGVVHGIEAQILSSDEYAFVYSGVNQPNITDRYTSHGAGTFNINPTDGLSGFYIGEQTLDQILSSKADADSALTTPIKNALMGVFDKILLWKDDYAETYRALKKNLGLDVVDSITLSQTSLNIENGGTVTLTATVSPSTISPTSLEWESDDENIATIDNNGVITAQSVGACTIQVSKDGITTQCSVEVIESSISYTVSYNLTDCTSSNNKTSTSRGSSYSTTISPKNGYKLETVTCTMGGETVTVTEGKISIPRVTGDIVITASAVISESHAINLNLTNVSSNNTETSVPLDSSYSTYLFPNDGCVITDAVTCTMGSENVTVSAGYIIDIPKVTDDVTIVANATQGTINTLVENFQEDSASASTTAEVNFQNGDYIECQIDFSTSKTYESIFSIGKEITSWTSSNSSRIHFSFDVTTHKLEVWFLGTGWKTGLAKYSNYTKSTMNIKITKDGVYLNNEYIVPYSSVFDTTYGRLPETYPNVINDFKTYTTIELGIGQREEESRSSATYNFIRVVKNPDTTTHSVTYNLTNCSSTNTITSVSKSASYETTLQPNFLMSLDTITCTMGGVEQTVTDGKISIANVTGDIVITATAIGAMSYTTLSSDFTTNNWKLDVPVNFANGDFIVMEVDLSNSINFTVEGLEVASFGTKIDTWAADNHTNFFWYCVGYGSTITSDQKLAYFKNRFQETTKSNGGHCTHDFVCYSSMPVTSTFAISKDGMWINGKLVDVVAGGSSPTDHSVALERLLSMTSIQVGRQEDSEGPELTYNWVRIYNANK